MGGGAWPFLVGGAICLVNSGNERDSSLLNRRRHLGVRGFGRATHWRRIKILLRGTGGFEPHEIEQ